MQVIKNNGSTIFWYLLIIICFYHLSFKAKDTQSLTVIFKDGLLSVEARGVKGEDIFGLISEKCGIEIRNYGRGFPPDPVNIRFLDLELKEGIRKIIKIAGIKNHSILYREVNPGKYQIYAIDFLGGGEATTNKQTRINAKEEEDYSEKDFKERMDEFKEKYQWESGDTQELASYLLEKMPERIRDSGLSTIIKALDKRIKEGEKDMVDEEMFIDAVDETLPRKIAPKMMNHMKKHINEFKGDEVYETLEELPSDLKQDSSDKKHLETMR